MSPHVLTFTKTTSLRISPEILTPTHSHTDQFHTIIITLTIMYKITYQVSRSHTNSLNTTSFSQKQGRNLNSTVKLAQAKGSPLS